MVCRRRTALLSAVLAVRHRSIPYLSVPEVYRRVATRSEQMYRLVYRCLVYRCRRQVYR